jgi:hypothetical protein
MATWTSRRTPHCVSGGIDREDARRALGEEVGEGVDREAEPEHSPVRSGFADLERPAELVKLLGMGVESDESLALSFRRSKESGRISAGSRASGALVRRSS